MIYDIAIIRVEGAFAGMRKIMAKCDHSGVAVDEVKEFRHIWDNVDRRGSLRVSATEFKVYFHYREEDAEIVTDWREKYDRSKRYRHRGGDRT